ncbi:hypothetical protein [Bacillus sp. 2205SS5-2]|uniref:hypothetical protein n=1 Tax=Bacillus sp. 2205SS5-2 TaxID=3109031 RepID=UPI003005544A
MKKVIFWTIGIACLIIWISVVGLVLFPSQRTLEAVPTISKETRVPKVKEIKKEEMTEPSLSGKVEELHFEEVTHLLENGKISIDELLFYVNDQ